MADTVDKKLKTALDETRLLILGVQILLGFEFQCVFQDGFNALATGSKYLSLASLGLVVLSIAFLIGPSMQSRLIDRGQSTLRLIRTTNRLTSVALVPLSIGLALSAYVVTERTFGPTIGVAVGALLGAPYILWRTRFTAIFPFGIRPGYIWPSISRSRYFCRDICRFH